MMTKVITTSQAFLSTAEPMAQLISALLELLNSEPFEALQGLGEERALRFVMDIRCNPVTIEAGAV